MSTAVATLIGSLIAVGAIFGGVAGSLLTKDRPSGWAWTVCALLVVSGLAVLGDQLIDSAGSGEPPATTAPVARPPAASPAEPALTGADLALFETLSDTSGLDVSTCRSRTGDRSGTDFPGGDGVQAAIGCSTSDPGLGGHTVTFVQYAHAPANALTDIVDAGNNASPTGKCDAPTTAGGYEVPWTVDGTVVGLVTCGDPASSLPYIEWAGNGTGRLGTIRDGDRSTAFAWWKKHGATLVPR